MKKSVKFFIGCCIFAAVVLTARTGLLQQFPWKEVKLPNTRGSYVLQVSNTPMKTPEISLPDISGYTYDAIKAKIPADLTQAQVEVTSIHRIREMTKFTELNYIPILQELQGVQEPIAIAIRSGAIDLPTLAQKINDPKLIQEREGAYYIYAPISIGDKATLVIAGKPDSRMEVHMSSVKGGFIVNGGKLITIDANLSGWNEKNGSYSTFQAKKKFRPFIAAWNGSETYLTKSSFRHMGYSASKSYGLSFSTDKTLNRMIPRPAPPMGWIVQCRFEGMYYAFYSYEAEHVTVVRSQYVDNIVYGWDPHDRSKHLIFAYNAVHGTKKKHGIITSRDVTDSYIFNNHTYNNRGSGIMLDRSSVRNVVANNISEHNKSDGITLFESQDNILVNNLVRFNDKGGLRVRNSWNVLSMNNRYFNNQSVGVQVYALDLSQDFTRDFVQDPYTIKADLTMSGDVLAMNYAGELRAQDFEFLRLHNIDIFYPFGRVYRGTLANFGTDLNKYLKRNTETMELARTEFAGPLRPGQWRPGQFDQPEEEESHGEDMAENEDGAVLETPDDE